MEHMCIYSKKTIRNATFDTREHIIPACIGGMQRLPIGYVCDDVNSIFSKLERPFARRSTISIMRRFLGPGKRGKVNPNKASASEIGVYQDNESSGLWLGYDKLNAPYSINQLYIRRDSGKVKLSLPPDDIRSHNELFEGLISELKSLKQSTEMHVILCNKLEYNDYILGYHKSMWYLAINPNQCEETAKDYVYMFAKHIPEAHKNDKFIIQQNISSTKITESQVQTSIKLEFNVNDYLRVIAKIAFNCLAHRKGRNFVHHHCFDPIRQAIYDGNEMFNFFELMDYSRKNNSQSFSDIFKHLDLLRNEKMGDQYHCILFFQVMGKLKCAVGLYGLYAPYIINLAENINISYIDGFFCDWRGRKEMTMTEYISAVIAQQ